MNYNSYPAIGIDNKIQKMQDALFLHLGFDNVDFYGRALKVLNKDGKSYVPEVHISNKERKEVYYDDIKAKGGNIFFIDDDNHSTKNGVLFTAKVKIVFMLNLNEIFGATPYRADSEVQETVLKLVNKLRIMTVTGIEKGLPNVLRDFDIERIKKNDLQPFHTFAVVGEINYLFNCKN